MPKKPDPKKSAKKTVPAPQAKGHKPAAKAAPKPAPKLAPKAPLPKGKVAPAVAKGAKASAAPSKSPSVAKPVPASKKALPVKGKAPSAPAKPVKGGKGLKESKADHAAQKKALNDHRGAHAQSGALEIAPRTKLQYYTLAELRQHLDQRSKTKTKLNVWVPDEERKAREKAAAAARAQGTRSHNVATASIADLLGGANPFRKGAGFVDESKQVPEKFRRYYRLLSAIREALQKGLAFHSEAALKKSGKDDAGDLSGYSQHLADAGTDTADRDFALSLISNEQEGLKEIADAIERMKNGNYGTCEITGKPIPHARLMAVPFTRYSLEGQKELERNRRAHRRRGGNPLGEISDEVGFGTGGGGGEDEPSDS